MHKARNSVKEIQASDASKKIEADRNIALIDVREQVEWDNGHISGAVHIPRGILEMKIEKIIPDKSTPVVLYCATGVRSLLAGRTLQTMGYTDVASLAGGFVSWIKAGFPSDAPTTLTDEQKTRYSRHLVIPEVGLEGQAKLLQAKVLIVGAGGLGSPAAYYLAAAGVGTLGIIDDDVVDDSNLQRQILHSTERLGMSKVESAEKTIKALNPDVNVLGMKERLSRDNVQQIIAGYDIIVDGTDNFPTRYLLNDASIIAGKPVVHGSVFRFEGQVTVYKPLEGPCYRCLFPEPPTPDLAPNCAEAGVLGVLPGTIGLLQATEVVKLILNIGEPLVGRLLMYDALSQSFDALRIYRDPQCPACGENAHPENLPTYEEICATS